MSLTFADLLSPDDILIDIDVSSKKHALQLLSEHIAARRAEISVDEVFDALIERERLGCTAAECGLAMPHARIAGITRTSAVFVRLNAGIDFDNTSGPDVDLLFAFIAPKQTTEDHDRQLRQLTAMLLDPEVGRALRTAPSATDIFDQMIALGGVERGGTPGYQQARK